MRLLHTRRIGLTPDGRPLPILVGSRFSAQTDRMQVGVMNVLEREHEGNPARSVTGYRVKTNVFARSYVGAMATQVAGGEDNVAGGVDGHFIFLDNLSFQTFVARSTTDGPGGEGWAAVPFWLTWDSELFLAEGQHMIIEDQFDPAVGFVGRSGIRRTLIDLAYRHRLRPDSPKILSPRAGFTYWTDPEGGLLTRDVNAGVTMTLLHGETIAFNYTRNTEREDRPFLVAGRLPVPPGTYESDQFFVRAEALASRRLSGTFGAATEEFWDGVRKTLNLQPRIRWSNQFVTELRYELGLVRLPSGSFTSRISEATLHLNVNNRWLTRTTVQHDALNDEWGVHFRLNYIYRTGDDFFVVLSRARTDGEDGWGVIFKATHTLAF
jgi:hypothetical protein